MARIEKAKTIPGPVVPGTEETASFMRSIVRTTPMGFMEEKRLTFKNKPPHGWQTYVSVKGDNNLTEFILACRKKLGGEKLTFEIKAVHTRSALPKEKQEKVSARAKIKAEALAKVKAARKARSEAAASKAYQIAKKIVKDFEAKCWAKETAERKRLEQQEQ